MRKTPSLIAAAAGVLVVLCVPRPAAAQPSVSAGHIASLTSGAIHGQVQDEIGAPVSGAVVSALGSSSAFAVTDHSGRFELRQLPPGPYLVRAHLTGFVAPRGQIVRVLPSTRASSSIALRRVTAVAVVAPPPLVPASLGPVADAEPAKPEPGGSSGGTSDPGEIAWRLNH